MIEAVGLAIWFGLLTAVSPCPMAANIAAISFIGRQISSRNGAVAAGLLYTLGRSLAYIAIAALIVSGALASPELSQFLQRYLNKLIGPILIIAAVFILEWLSLPSPGGLSGEKAQKVAQKAGWIGPLVLGFVFALSFCPVSAAWFFLSLIPLALKTKSPIILPLVYGLGTALPVILVAIVLAFSANAIGRTYNSISRIERWARLATGAVFLAAGFYLTLTHIYLA